MKPKQRENIRYSEGAENPIELEEKIMFSLLPKCENKKLLDVGCGVGTIALKLQKRGFKVDGIDFSEVAVEKTQKKGINVILSDLDEEGIRFPDNTFDVVWTGDVIEHVFDPIFLFEEISRVLRDDGRLLLSVPNDFHLYNRINIFLTGKSIQSNIYRTLRQCKHHTFFSWELLQFMLRQGKLNVERFYSVLRFPKTKNEKSTSSKFLGIHFGRIFIVQARKIL